MKNWITKSAMFLFACAAYLFGQYLRGPWFENFPWSSCRNSIDAQGVFCNSPSVDTGLVLIAAGEILAIAAVMLLFANKEGMRKWAWASIVYLPVSVLIISSINPNPSGWINFTPSPEHVTWLLGYGYLLLTFAIVAGTRYAARMRPE